MVFINLSESEEISSEDYRNMMLSGRHISDMIMQNLPADNEPSDVTIGSLAVGLACVCKFHGIIPDDLIKLIGSVESLLQMTEDCNGIYISMPPTIDTDNLM